MARTVTWWYQDGPRQKLIRVACLDGAVDDTTIVVADLEGPPTIDEAGRRVTITVNVPDRSESTETFEFSVAGFRQVDPP